MTIQSAPPSGGCGHLPLPVEFAVSYMDGVMEAEPREIRGQWQRVREHLVHMPPAEDFQARVTPWLDACFGNAISGDRAERNHRFLEEALELVQSAGCTASDAHQLVHYVFGRPVGEPKQEVGGVMLTLAALCLANGLDMHEAGDTELARVWTMIDQIRAKQAAKPKHSPLPISVRGFVVQYRPGTTCPGCGKGAFNVGRSSAECAGCGTALPLAPESN